MKRLLILAGMLAGAGHSPANAQQFGAFQFVRASDPITDADESFVFTTELEPSPLRTARLIWRCDSAESIELFIMADEFLDTGDPVYVQWRFDREPPSSRDSWGPSRRGTGAFAPDWQIPGFTEEALAAAGLVVRVWDYRDVEYDLRFSMSGASAAIQRLPCYGAVADLARRTAEEVEARAAREAEAKRREQERAELMENALFIGNPNTKSFYPARLVECWRRFVDTKTAVPFRTLEEAQAAGYHRSPQCRGLPTG